MDLNSADDAEFASACTRRARIERHAAAAWKGCLHLLLLPMMPLLSRQPIGQPARAAGLEFFYEVQAGVSGVG